MKLWDESNEIPEPYRCIAILWLSFLMAGVATMLLFAYVDPMDLRRCFDIPDFGDFGIYSIGFLSFWLLTATSSLLAAYFVYPRRRDPKINVQTPAND